MLSRNKRVQKLDFYVFYNMIGKAYFHLVCSFLRSSWNSPKMYYNQLPFQIQPFKVKNFRLFFIKCDLRYFIFIFWNIDNFNQENYEGNYILKHLLSEIFNFTLLKDSCFIECFWTRAETWQVTITVAAEFFCRISHILFFNWLVFVIIGIVSRFCS